MSFIILYVTFPSEDVARKLCMPLLKSKLIACVNYYQMSSSYLWKGKIEHADECGAILKTRKGMKERVEEELRKAHPYETPCIMCLPVSANKDYEKWIIDETRG